MQDERMFRKLSSNLNARSISVVESLEKRHREIAFYWTIVASLAVGIRLTASSFLSLPFDAQIGSALPYPLVIGAPIATMLLAFYWFRNTERMPQPAIRLAHFGRWRMVSPSEARSSPFYGTTGIMASLLVGILMNVPVRTLEFLAAMPVLGAAPPEWFGSLFGLMLLDCVILSSLYAVAFVAALRRVPLFPRLLAAIWAIDIVMQIGIARIMAGVEDLPPNIGVALHGLLEGNMKKVLISLVLWTPYLLLSKRVNATFRHRLPERRLAGSPSTGEADQSAARTE